MIAPEKMMTALGASLGGVAAVLVLIMALLNDALGTDTGVKAMVALLGFSILGRLGDWASSYRNEPLEETTTPTPIEEEMALPISQNADTAEQIDA